jgi:lysophospholipase L1-like esterase
MAKALGITPVLMTQPHASVNNELTPGWANGENQRLFNSAVRATASDRQVALVDLDKAMISASGFAKQPLLFLYDGMHATDRGSELMAQAIADKLLELIESRS